MIKISLKSKLYLTMVALMVTGSLVVHTLIVLKMIEQTYEIAVMGYIFTIIFIPNFLFLLSEVYKDVRYQAEAAVAKKSNYLEHSAKIIRHDMHSGINTYIPRGLNSLKRRLSDQDIKKLKLETPIKLIEEGLRHSQQVYEGARAFTDLVKKDAKLKKENYKLDVILDDYLHMTSYKDQVVIEELVELNVNKALFCTAIDNLIRNGLRYNDSKTKRIVIRMAGPNEISVTDNGRGMTNCQFEIYSQPYSRGKNQKEKGSGLGLSITQAILYEHGFDIYVNENYSKRGTDIRIRIL
jgi:K+-sensing histidine kinase KdpD